MLALITFTKQFTTSVQSKIDLLLWGLFALVTQIVSVIEFTPARRLTVGNQNSDMMIVIWSQDGHHCFLFTNFYTTQCNPPSLIFRNRLSTNDLDILGQKWDIIDIIIVSSALRLRSMICRGYPEKWHPWELFPIDYEEESHSIVHQK